MLLDYLGQGLKAGLAAGLVFGLLLSLVANPLIGAAEALAHDEPSAHGEESAHGEAAGAHAEDHHEAGASDHGHESAVSTGVTTAVSALSGVLWGLLLGGVGFGIAFYFLEPAIPGTGATKSYVLAAAGFVTVSGAPWLVLPPQPAGAEQALATQPRMLLYGGMMVAGAIACLCSGLVYTHLREERTMDRPIAAAVALLPFGLLAIPVMLAPANPIEHSLPPELATALVGLTVFGQVLVWAVLATVHAGLHHRDTARSTAQQVEAAPADPGVTAD